MGRAWIIEMEIIPVFGSFVRDTFGDEIPYLESAVPGYHRAIGITLQKWIDLSTQGWKCINVDTIQGRISGWELFPPTETGEYFSEGKAFPMRNIPLSRLK